jgi:uncharacterized OB-fold protein
VTAEPFIADIGTFEATFLGFIAVRDLRIARWDHTGEILGYASRAPAPDGARSVRWEKASGSATLHAFTIYHREYHPDFKVPYNVAEVALAEAPILISTVIVSDQRQLRVGMELSAVFEPSGRLVFHPATSAKASA